MDVSVRLPDGSELVLEATCRPDAAGWLHRAGRDREVTVGEALGLAGPRHADEILRATRVLLDHLGECGDAAAQEPEHGEGVRLAERVWAAEHRLGCELGAALAELEALRAA